MKQELAIVYVDYGACNILNDPKSRPMTPNTLQPMIDNLSNGVDTEKHVFLDTRGIEKDAGVEAYNNTLNQWSSFDIHSCPRIGLFSKETIDQFMIRWINRQVEHLHAFYDLHIILVIGDVDYLPLVTRLLDLSIRVSLIATKPHATLNYTVLSRCHVCYATFEIDDAHARIFKPFDVATKDVAQQLGSYQTHYRPTTEQRLRAIAFSGTAFVCDICGQEVLTGNLRAHPCFKVKDAPPGLPTVSYLQEMGKALSGYSVPELLEFLILALHNQTLPFGLAALFESMPHIPWDALEAAILAHRIEHSAIGLPVNQVNADLAKHLIRAGIIQRTEERYCIAADTRSIQALNPLIEEAYSRAHFPNIMRLLVPEGAIREERLRERITAILETAHALETGLIPQIDPMDSELWDSDIALSCLTHPQLQPSRRKEIQDILDPIHPFNDWMARLINLSSTPNSDLLDRAEHLARGNPFMTPKSLKILITNHVLQLNQERGQLIANTSSHPLFIPFDNQAVA